MSDQVEIEGLTDLAVIGRGGEATVFRAYDPRLDRVVAVKLFEHSLDSDRLRNELLALGRLGDHPHIAEVMSHGATGDGRPYFTMPLYPNGSLHDRVEETGALSLESVLRTGVRICGALAAAHAEGIIHGDVKPHNILITRYDDVVLADFGVARFIASDDGSQELRGFTPAWSAPDVLQHNASTAASDVYSLGLTLAYALTGQEPTTPGLAPRVDAVNGPDIDAILTACNANDPDARPSARQLATMLRAAQAARHLGPTEFIGPVPGPDLVRSVPLGAGGPVTATDVPTADGVQRRPAEVTSVPPEQVVTQRRRRRSPERTLLPLPRRPVRLRSDGDQTFAPAPAGSDDTRLSAAARRDGRRRTPVDPVVDASAAPEAPDRNDQVTDDPWRRVLESFAADRPTGNDLLGYGPLVTGIVRLLSEDSTNLPMTIGVTGEWGAGKTSLMMQVRDGLVASEVPWTPVWFDAWKFQGRDSIWAGLAREVYAQAQAQRRTAVGRAHFRLGLERRRRGWAASCLALAIVLGCLVFVIHQSIQTASGGFGWPGVGSIGAAVAAIGSVAAFFGLVSAPFERAVARGSATRQYDAQLGISNEAEQDIEHLLDAATSGRRRVAVFLDDVDRCSSATILETLTTVTEIFGRRAHQEVAFILGVDMEMVVSAVHDQMADLRTALQQLNERRAEELGHSYLEKIFQLTVRLDAFGRVPVERLFTAADEDGANISKVRAFVKRLGDLTVENPGEITAARREAGMGTVLVGTADLGPLRAAVRQRRAELLNPASSPHVLQAEAMVMRGVRMTPRAAKRFDNAFRLQLQVANSTEGCELEFDPDSLLAAAKWVAIRMFFPRFTACLDGELGLLGELEELARDPARHSAFRRRIEDLGLSTTTAGELRRLLALGPLGSIVSRLPLDTFVTIV